MCYICFIYVNTIQPFEVDFECVMKMGLYLLTLSLYRQGLTKVIVLLYRVCVVDFQQGAKKAYKTNDIVWMGLGSL
jgi:hypothetical protein